MIGQTTTNNNNSNSNSNNNSTRIGSTNNNNMIGHLFGRRRCVAIQHLKLREIINAANIHRILFLRHGQTAKQQPEGNGGNDFDRVLTSEGRKQAKRSGELFGRNLQPYYNPVLVSPAPRTMETATIFLQAAVDASPDSNNDDDNIGVINGDENPIRDIDLIQINSLYDGTLQPKGDEIFDLLGYAPLKEYLQNNNEHINTESRQFLGDYTENAIASIIEVVTNTTANNNTNNEIKADANDDATTLLLVAHAIYLPAAVLGVASLLGCFDNNKEVEGESSYSHTGSTAMDVLLSTNTNEADGYLIDVKHKSVRYLSRDDAI